MGYILININSQSVIEIEPIPDDSVGKYRVKGLNGPSKRRSRRLRRLDGPFNTRSSVFPNRVSLVQALSLL